MLHTIALAGKPNEYNIQKLGWVTRNVSACVFQASSAISLFSAVGWTLAF